MDVVDKEQGVSVLAPQNNSTEALRVLREVKLPFRAQLPTDSLQQLATIRVDLSNACSARVVAWSLSVRPRLND